MLALRTINYENLIPARPSESLLQRRLKHGTYKYDIDGLQKYCARCQEYWPADSEFFFCNKNEGDGLMPWCKVCYDEYRYGEKKKDAA